MDIIYIILNLLLVILFESTMLWFIYTDLNNNWKSYMDISKFIKTSRTFNDYTILLLSTKYVYVNRIADR